MGNNLAKEESQKIQINELKIKELETYLKDLKDLTDQLNSEEIKRLIKQINNLKTENNFLQFIISERMIKREKATYLYEEAGTNYFPSYI